MSTEIYSEEIEKFLKGELSLIASIRIKKRMKRDPAFRRIVNLHRLVLEGIKNTVDKDVGQQLVPPSQNLSAPFKATFSKPAFTRSARPKARLMTSVLSIAAALLILFFVGSELLLPWFYQKETIETALNQEMEVSIGVASENDSLLVKAQNTFNDKNYKVAAELFGAYLGGGNVSNAEVLLYRGIALRKLAAYPEAIAVFNELINTSQQHYSGDEAIWQLSLTYLQQENYEACRQQLDRLISNEKSKKVAEARELKKSIRFK
jgi:tetratricopeptide (TPR) repeat protein